MSKLKPYQLVSVQLPTSKRRRVVQTISCPIPNDDNRPDTIKVRMVPGDPTTMTELPVADLKTCERKGRWVHVAKVKAGVGGIPEDMLRYDGASYYNQQLPETDAEGQEPRGDPFSDEVLGNRPGEGWTLVYAVTSSKTPPWTVDRWNSFCCALRHLKTQDLNDVGQE